MSASEFKKQAGDIGPKDSIMKKPRKKIVNRTLLTPKQYINLLATPRPTPPELKQVSVKRPLAKPPQMCSPRLDVLSMPTKKLMEGVLMDYHEKFEPERVLCMAKRIHIVSTQCQNRNVCSKKKPKKKKKKKRKPKKQSEEELAKEWIRDQINTSSFLIMLHIKYRQTYTPNYKQLLIALRIMKMLRLKKRKKYPKFTKRYLLKICEQIAILIDSTCPPNKQRFPDVSAKIEEPEERKHICWRIHSDLSILGVEVEPEEGEEEEKEAEEEAGYEGGEGEGEEELLRLERLLHELEVEEALTEEEEEMLSLQDLIEAYEEPAAEDETFMEGYGIIKEFPEEGDVDIKEVLEEIKEEGEEQELKEGLEAEEADILGGEEDMTDALDKYGLEGEGEAIEEIGKEEGEDIPGGEDEEEGEGEITIELLGEEEGEGLMGDIDLAAKEEEKLLEGMAGEAELEPVKEALVEAAAAVLPLEAPPGGYHPEGTVCYLTWKIYCQWLTEFGENIQKYGKCLRNFRNIFGVPNKFNIQLIQTILANWSKYFGDCRQFEDKLTKYFNGRKITSCPLCLEDYDIDDIPADHDVPKDLIDVIRSTATWSEMLEEAEKACKAIEEPEPLSPDQLSLLSIGTIEFTDVSGMSFTSDESFIVVEEVDNNAQQDPSQNPPSCQKPK